MSYFWDLVDLFLLGLPLQVGSIILPLVSNNLNLKLPVYVFPFLDCGAWGTGALLISWEDLDSFVFVPVALDKSRSQERQENSFGSY